MLTNLDPAKTTLSPYPVSTNQDLPKTPETLIAEVVSLLSFTNPSIYTKKRKKKELSKKWRDMWDWLLYLYFLKVLHYEIPAHSIP
jgi:hypothetical protein